MHRMKRNTVVVRVRALVVRGATVAATAPISCVVTTCISALAEAVARWRATPGVGVELGIVVVANECGGALVTVVTATTAAATNPHVIRGTRHANWNTVVAPESSVVTDTAVPGASVFE